MLRQFSVVSRALGASLLMAGALAACGIKGPLRPASASPAAAPSQPAPTNPQARPPLLPSEPPAAIAPSEPAKKP